MKVLKKANPEEIIISPRFPYDTVVVSDIAYQQILKVQKMLISENIELILTRGYESSGKMVKWGHTVARLAGTVLFAVVYPQRIKECWEIFSSNGHDQSSRNCLDISIVYEGKYLNLLPYGVFTSRKCIKRLRDLHSHALGLVWDSLAREGFVVHENYTEAMQIHCELRSLP